MKRMLQISIPFLIAVLTFNVAHGQNTEEAEIEITPSDTVVVVDAEFQFNAFLVTDSSKVDTTFSWQVSDTTLASIDAEGNFYALSHGEVVVTATLDSLEESVEVEIEEAEDGEGEEELLISPSDTLVTIGTEVQYVVRLSSDSVEVTDSVEWSISSEIGTIDSSGKATFTANGFGFVDAEYNGEKARASVRVKETVEDSTGTQNINIFVPKNNPKSPPKEYNISEGDVFRLTGFASPLNYLNGGTVYFPNGSIIEDIRIDISREDYTGTTEDGKRIVGGIGFDVFVNDSLISPYEFERPIEISIPFKRGLLENLGIDVQNLGMFNLDDSGEVDTVGVSSVTVDSVGGRIFGYVSHFSTYVLMPTNDVTTSTEEELQGIPEGFNLAQNYPNPFNPTSTIRFSVPLQTQVTLEVFNVLGQKVSTLISNKKLTAGWHSVQFDASNLSSGVYIYRMTADNFTLTKQMMLIK